MEICLFYYYHYSAIWIVFTIKRATDTKRLKTPVVNYYYTMCTEGGKLVSYKNIPKPLFKESLTLLFLLLRAI